MISYDYFKDKRYFEYHLYNHLELSLAIKDFKYIFENQVLNFLYSYSDMMRLFELIEKGEIKKLDTTASPDNYLHWLIIASQNGATNLESLAKHYLEDFWKNNDVQADRSRVQNLLQDLLNT